MKVPPLYRGAFLGFSIGLKTSRYRHDNRMSFRAASSLSATIPSAAFKRPDFQRNLSKNPGMGTSVDPGRHLSVCRLLRTLLSAVWLLGLNAADDFGGVIYPAANFDKNSSLYRTVRAYNLRDNQQACNSGPKRHNSVLRGCRGATLSCSRVDGTPGAASPDEYRTAENPRVTWQQRWFAATVDGSAVILKIGNNGIWITH